MNMEIRRARGFLPPPLETEILRQPAARDALPGFLVGMDENFVSRPSAQSILDEVRRQGGYSGLPCVVIAPDQTRSIFPDDEQLDLLRRMAALVAEQIHPHLRTAIDVIFFVHGAARLKAAWARPERDNEDFLFKIAGLALDAAEIVGRVDPSLKIPDRWANGVNFVVKSGGDVFQGRTTPIHETLLSADQSLAIAFQLQHIVSAALDPSPSFQNLTAVPLSSTKREREERLPASDSP